MIKNITINEEWLYHQISNATLRDILDSGYILSKRNLGYNRLGKGYNSWNGLDYISLAKRKGYKYDSSYEKIIKNQFAFVIEGVDEIATTYRGHNYDFWRWFAESPFGKRYSCYKDEVQVRDMIPISKIIGIKIPEKDIAISSMCPRYIDDIKYVEIFLNTLNEKHQNFPFIDIEEGKLIDKEDIKKYIRKRQ